MGAIGVTSVLSRSEVSQGQASFDEPRGASLHGLRATLPGVVESPTSARAKVVVNYEGSAPTWLFETVDRLRHLLALAENWDSYGASPVSEVAVRDVLVLLQDLMPMTWQAPFIAPLANGGLQVEWAMHEVEVGFLVNPDEGTTAYVFSEDTDEEWSLSGPRSVSRLVAAVRALPET